MQRRDLDLGFLAVPDEDDSAIHPGVVMIHDVWGLGPHAFDMASRLADEGFAVLAVDLYRGLGSKEVGDPGRWIRGLSDPDMLVEVQAAIDHLGQGPSRGRKVGVMGYCMGGMYALLAGCRCSGLDACVPFYGLLSYSHGLLFDEAGLDPERKPVEPLQAASDLRCPMQGFFGAEDPFIPVEDVEAMKIAAASSGQPAEVKIYPTAGHAFMNDTREDAYRPYVARDAWALMTAFLHQQLDGRRSAV